MLDGLSCIQVFISRQKCPGLRRTVQSGNYPDKMSCIQANCLRSRQKICIEMNCLISKQNILYSGEMSYIQTKYTVLWWTVVYSAKCLVFRWTILYSDKMSCIQMNYLNIYKTIYAEEFTSSAFFSLISFDFCAFFNSDCFSYTGSCPIMKIRTISSMCAADYFNNSYDVYRPS